MEKVVFFQPDHQAGFCPIDERPEFQYEQNLKPIRFNMLECTEIYKKQLFKLCRKDPKEFSKQVNEELDNSLYIHSN